VLLATGIVGTTIAPTIAVQATGIRPVRVLILSRVALTAGLPFALIPLTMMTNRKNIMGALSNRRGPPSRSRPPSSIRTPNDAMHP
jgi:manganese transport protein